MPPPLKLEPGRALEPDAVVGDVQEPLAANPSDTKRALERAALRYLEKIGDAGRESEADAPYTTRTGWGSFSAW